MVDASSGLSNTRRKPKNQKNPVDTLKFVKIVCFSSGHGSLTCVWRRFVYLSENFKVSSRTTPRKLYNTHPLSVCSTSTKQNPILNLAAWTSKEEFDSNAFERSNYLNFKFWSLLFDICQLPSSPSSHQIDLDLWTERVVPENRITDWQAHRSERWAALLRQLSNTLWSNLSYKFACDNQQEVRENSPRSGNPDNSQWRPSQIRPFFSNGCQYYWQLLDWAIYLLNTIQWMVFIPLLQLNFPFKLMKEILRKFMHKSKFKLIPL